MTLDSLESGPGYLFRRMQQIAVAIFTEECARFDLTCLQFSTLARICEQPGIDVTRLSEIMEFDRSTLGGVVERLEIKGHIRRRGTTEDKRIKLLEITRQGRKLLDEIQPAVERTQKRTLSGLSGDEQKTLLKLLTRLVELNAHVGPTPSSRTEPHAATIVALRKESGASGSTRIRKRTAISR